MNKVDESTSGSKAVAELAIVCSTMTKVESVLVSRHSTISADHVAGSPVSAMGYPSLISVNTNDDPDLGLMSVQFHRRVDHRWSETEHISVST